MERQNMLAFSDIKRHFLDDQLLARYVVFARCKTQVEGWFKGELALLFARSIERGLITTFVRERKVGPSTFDFLIADETQEVLIELKCGHQSYGRDRSLGNWFTTTGVNDDL